MAEKNIYIVTFDDSSPQWAIFNGKDATLTSPPQGKADLQVVVLLPERFFFYHLPKVLKSKREGALRKAILLQLNNYFPSLGGGATVGMLPSVHGMILGFFAKPELKSFMEEHLEVFSQASVVTTGFALCWDAAMESRTPCWSWRGEGGEHALFVEDEFQFFRGGENEYRRRLALFQLSENAPVPVTLGEALADIHRSKRRWTRYKLPFKVGRAEGEALGSFLPKVAVFTLIAALFLAGQFTRWSAWGKLADDWNEKTKELYAQVLGPKIGADPFGKLLSLLDQLNTDSVQGLDALTLLEAMSKDAPASFRIDSLSLSADSGSVSGSIGSYDELERYVEKLKEATGFTFVLEQAANTEDGIKCSFKVAQGQ